ncbi:MAG: SWIM zinc finger family protein, partial [Deltaproteobacteria bacterium]|nr:SWIM zinc finger family protein [Deltaproteobacteria bacterium]
DWKKLARKLSHQAIFAAKLLAGEMPQDIERAFKDAGVSLFPEKLKELDTDCSCTDWSNPCKHIAAVYYLLGEEFDRDPFLILKLRGMNREEIIGLLSGAKGKTTSKYARGKSVASETGEEVFLPPEVPALDVSAFWDGSSLPNDLFGEVRIAPLPAALPKRLGSFPFWRGEQRFLEAIEPIYIQASPRGMDLFLICP